MKYTKFVLAAAVVIVIALVVLLNKPAASAQIPLPLSEAELRDLALEVAHFTGLEGDPTSEDYTFMTLGQYATLIQAGSPYQVGDMTRDSLVFVYQVTGSIPHLSMPGYMDPNEIYGSLVIVLNAQTGQHFATSAAKPGTEVDIHASVVDEGTPSFIPTSPPFEPGTD